MNITNQIVLKDKSVLDIFPKEVLNVLTKTKADELYGTENEYIFLDKDSLTINFGHMITSSMCDILGISTDDYIKFSNGLYESMKGLKGKAEPFEVLYYEDIGMGESSIYYYKYENDKLECFSENDYDLGSALLDVDDEEGEDEIYEFINNVMDSLNFGEVPTELEEAFAKVDPVWTK